MKKVTTRVAEISYSNDHILRVKIFNNAEIELEDAIQNSQATIALTRGDKYLVLVDARANLSVSKEARAYASEERGNERRIAEAFIVTSTANKLIGNFYINFNKPKMPTKLFSSEEKAIEWLEEFLFLTGSANPFETKTTKKVELDRNLV